ncbi:MAG: YhbY family RNA-binding protein [Provencibacterium sp.]|jgi:RNA-binding protein|nr:YhbY family RNA-binding protein [Provencibacterium sp.]
MLSSKQRAQLRGFANDLPTILQVGKGGVTDTVYRQADEALTARELIKLRVLENAPVTAREAAEEIAARVSADVVQVIGTRAVLFRANKESSFAI